MRRAPRFRWKMPANERVLVVGATQGTGSEIVRLLLRDHYRVRVLARDEAKAREKFGETVEIVVGDITKPSTLASAMKDLEHIIFTAGVTKRPASEQLVKTTEYDGVLNTLAAAGNEGFNGRFLYMSAIGTTKPSLLGFLLNLVKGNTLLWRKRAEDAVRQSGLDYTIIHAGVLTDDPPGQKAIVLSRRERRMFLKYRISRADVAEVFVQALRHPSTRNMSFDAVWAIGDSRAVSNNWDALFARLSRSA